MTSKRQLDLVNVARDEKIVGVEFLIGWGRPLSHFLNAFFRLDVLCIPVSCYLPPIFVLLLVSNNLMLSKALDYWPLNRTHHSSSRARFLFIWSSTTTCDTCISTKYKIQNTTCDTCMSWFYVQMTSSKFLFTTPEWYLHVIMCKNLSKWYYEHLSFVLCWSCLPLTLDLLTNLNLSVNFNLSHIKGLGIWWGYCWIGDGIQSLRNE